MTQNKDPMQVLVTSRRCRCRGLLDVVLLMLELTRLSTRLPAAWGKTPADVTFFLPWRLMLEFTTNVYVM